MHRVSSEVDDAFLPVLGRAGRKGGGLSTRQLHQKVGKMHNAQGMIKRAEQQGLIRRKSVAPEGRGNWLVVNHLTQKGRQLLDKLAGW